jgi:adenine-specific DNA methylase
VMASVTTGWEASCSCNADAIPCTVLDPFSGAGTTALVADRLQRNAIGIELNPTYAAMSERRINGDRGALLDLMEAAE